MPQDIYRYIFSPGVHFPEVAATLDLAFIAIESLHGESRARLDARFTSEPSRRTVILDATTPVGQALNQVFVGFVRREFGEDAFTVRRVEAASPHDERVAAT
ncbi:MAG: hypothetical protein KF768_05430 [Phycisphaeraceae bacterium]|nr:hypothetical protein [Phycisphaeraceae bacterium]